MRVQSRIDANFAETRYEKFSAYERSLGVTIQANGHHVSIQTTDKYGNHHIVDKSIPLHELHQILTNALKDK